MPPSGDTHNSPLQLPSGSATVRVRVNGAEPVDRELSQSVTIVGSRRDCDIPILCADVSKVHCAIVNTGSAVCVIDLCSRCGTSVDGREVDVVLLGADTTVQVGSAELQITVGAAKRPIREIGADPLRLPAPLVLARSDTKDVLLKAPAIIGRRNACHVRVDTPDASLAHALLAQIGGQLAIFDLGSRSGTFMNGERAACQFLADGDEIRIGGQVFVVSTSSAVPSRPGPAADMGSRPAALPPAATVIAAPPAPESPPLTILRYIQDSVLRLCDDFRQQEERLAAQAAALAQGESKLVHERSGLEEWRRSLEHKEQELREREAALTRREAVGEGMKRQARQSRGGLNDPAPATPDPSRSGLKAASDSSSGGDFAAPLIARPLFSGPDAEREVRTRRSFRGNA